ncbi:MAG: DUF6089 family protein [Chitinophagaceae bacterium]
MQLRIILCTLLVSITCHCATSQIFYRLSEFGISGGSSAYFGDLNDNYGFKFPRYSGGIFYKYNASPYIAIKLGGTYAHIGYSDKFSNNFYQKMRNLDFQSDIYEGAVSAEFHFFRYEIGEFDYRFTPYVTVGAGIFYYNPYTFLNGKKYFLRPLGTEGQNFEEYKNRRYGKTAVAFPIGAGIKFWFAKGVTIYLEVANRSTTTDYLDDVSTTYIGKENFIDPLPSPYPLPVEQLQDRSYEVTNNPIGIKGRQRGVNTTRDKYMTMQLGISFRLPTYKCPSNIR